MVLLLLLNLKGINTIGHRITAVVTGCGLSTVVTSQQKHESKEMNIKVVFTVFEKSKKTIYKRQPVLRVSNLRGASECNKGPPVFDRPVSVW